MLDKTPVKAALIVALIVAAAFTGRHAHGSTDVWITAAVLCFGVVNVLFSTPGTRWVRAAAILAACGALAGPTGDYRAMFLLFACLVWPLIFLFAWWIERDTQPSEGREDSTEGARQSRVVLAAIIGGAAVASLAYRVVFAHGLQQTAALFVGIPTLLALVTVFGVSPRSATGVACKAVTVFLLVSMIFLGEGMLCIAMSAPLFYAVAVMVGASVDLVRRRRRRRSQNVVSCVALLALIPMSLEGVTDATSFDRNERVSSTRIVHASSQEVEHALFEAPRFNRRLPLYLRAGFPRPISTRIDERPAPTRWVIRFRGGEMRLGGMEPRAGDVVLELEEARPGLVRWRVAGDDSHMTHFLSWRESVVQWEAIDARTTKVTWTLRYRRGLDPAWYFGPWERYAARLAAGYLIDTVATP